MFNALYGVLKSMTVLAWGAVELFLDDLATGTVNSHPAHFPGFDRECLRFQKRSLFIRAYRKAFNDDKTTALVECHPFGALGQVRHVIVHRASVLDGDFVEVTEKNDSLARYYRYSKANEPLKLDGFIVKRCVDESVAVCFSLLQAVDSWITSATNARTASSP